MQGWLGNDDVVYASQLPLRGDKDYVMSLLALLSEDDRGSAYRVRELEGSVRQNGYTIPQMEISRKEQKA